MGLEEKVFCVTIMMSDQCDVIDTVVSNIKLKLRIIAQEQICKKRFWDHKSPKFDSCMSARSEEEQSDD